VSNQEPKGPSKKTRQDCGPIKRSRKLASGEIVEEESMKHEEKEGEKKKATKRRISEGLSARPSTLTLNRPTDNKIARKRATDQEKRREKGNQERKRGLLTMLEHL